MRKISLSRQQVIVGTLALIVAVVTPILLLQPAPSRVATAERFISDLERIKAIAPKNAELETCLLIEKESSFEQKYEDCFSRIKQNQNEARSLLERNRSSIKVFYGDALLAEIQDNIEILDYLLYEMGNNQYLLWRWQEDGCPEKVDFISPEKLTKERVIEGPDGAVRCALVIQTSEAFLRRQGDDCSQDCLSALRIGLISTEEAAYAIVPGSTQSLNKFFLEKNNELYSLMLSEIDDLLIKVRKQI